MTRASDREPLRHRDFLLVFGSPAGPRQSPEEPAKGRPEVQRCTWLDPRHVPVSRRIAALLALWTAVARDWSPFLAAGEKATIAVIAADRPQARSVLRYITGLIDVVPMLRQLVVRRTASAIELQSKGGS